MGHFKDEMGRLGSALSMGFWIGLMVWGGVWLLLKGWWVLGHGNFWVGAVMVVLGGMVCVTCARGVWLVVMLLLGYTTPRLARRDFRNSLSNMIMLVKTGIKD